MALSRAVHNQSCHATLNAALFMAPRPWSWLLAAVTTVLLTRLPVLIGCLGLLKSRHQVNRVSASSTGLRMLLSSLLLAAGFTGACADWGCNRLPQYGSNNQLCVGNPVNGAYSMDFWKYYSDGQLGSGADSTYDPDGVEPWYTNSNSATKCSADLSVVPQSARLGRGPYAPTSGPYRCADEGEGCTCHAGTDYTSTAGGGYMFIGRKYMNNIRTCSSPPCATHTTFSSMLTDGAYIKEFTGGWPKTCNYVTFGGDPHPYFVKTCCARKHHPTPRACLVLSTLTQTDRAP